MWRLKDFIDRMDLKIPAEDQAIMLIQKKMQFSCSCF